MFMKLLNYLQARAQFKSFPNEERQQPETQIMLLEHCSIRFINERYFI